MSTHYTEFTGMPFVAGDVQGIRSWDVDQLGRLISPSYKTVWTPGENVAECKKRDDEFSWTLPSSNMMRLSFTPSSFAPGGMVNPSISYADPAPERLSETAVKERKKKHSQEKCSCGFYAYSNGRNDYSESTRLTGVIQGFGETQLGTRGFKCGKARILALHVPAKGDKVRLGQVTTHSRHFEQVVANYPDVKVFAKYRDMLAEFPTYEHAPTPETDPDFWTRSI